MFSLVVRFTVLPDHLQAFDELAADTIRSIRAKEPGTIIYLNHARADHPSERVFYEAYQDHGAFIDHGETEHTRDFLAEREQHLAVAPEVWWLNTTGPESY